MTKRMWVAILLSIPLTGVLAQDVVADQHAIDQGACAMDSACVADHFEH